jgi:ABC-type nickel/cobalt efflux system permease component RcnA
MGNFSINHYSRFEAHTDGLTLRYRLDLAEIPTVSEKGAMDTDGDGRISDAERAAYLNAKAAELRDGLTLTLNGRPAPLEIRSADMAFRPGAGGLDTLLLTLDLSAALPAVQTAGTVRAAYRDGNFDGRTGWKEIIAVAGPGAALANSSASTTDISRGLAFYPADAGVVPPQQTEATFTIAGVGGSSPRRAAPGVLGSSTRRAAPGVSGWGLGAEAKPTLHPGRESTPFTAIGSLDGERPTPIPQPPTPGASTPQDAFTQSIATRKLTPGVVLSLLALAFVFGAFHALSPGHGKTMVAAYLVGTRGTVRHAAFLGAVVTITHTIGVFALGIVTLVASRYVVPERLYPILSALSGVAIVVIGVTLLRQRLAALQASSHAHTHDPAPTQGHYHDHAPAHSHSQDHDHRHAHDHTHAHDHDQHHNHSPAHGSVLYHEHGDGHYHAHEIPEDLSLKALLVLGITGGALPCPSALVVMLSAIALHRVAFGLALITSFSLGLATVLTAAGILVIKARGLLDRLPSSEHRGRLMARLPIVSAAIVTVIGLVLVVRAVI